MYVEQMWSFNLTKIWIFCEIVFGDSFFVVTQPPEMPTSSSASSLSMSWRTYSPGSTSTTTSTKSVDLTRKSTSPYKPGRVSTCIFNCNLGHGGCYHRELSMKFGNILMNWRALAKTINVQTFVCYFSWKGNE